MIIELIYNNADLRSELAKASVDEDFAQEGSEYGVQMLYPYLLIFYKESNQSLFIP